MIDPKNLTTPDHNQIEVSVDEMHISGNWYAIARFLKAYNETPDLHAEMNELIREHKEKEKPIIQWWRKPTNIMKLSPRQMAKGYIDYVKPDKYNREDVIDYIKKNLVKNQKLTVAYRHKVLQTVHGLINNPKGIDQSYRHKTKRPKTRMIPTPFKVPKIPKQNRKYIKRDWNDLALRWLKTIPQPSKTDFLSKEFGYHVSNFKLFNAALKEINQFISGKKQTPVVGTVSLKEILEKETKPTTTTNNHVKAINP